MSKKTTEVTVKEEKSIEIKDEPSSSSPSSKTPATVIEAKAIKTEVKQELLPPSFSQLSQVTNNSASDEIVEDQSNWKPGQKFSTPSPGSGGLFPFSSFLLSFCFSVLLFYSFSRSCLL
jgi:LAS superfamily LD-carboxypeptidase LdcB